MRFSFSGFSEVFLEKFSFLEFERVSRGFSLRELLLGSLLTTLIWSLLKFRTDSAWIWVFSKSRVLVKVSVSSKIRVEYLSFSRAFLRSISPCGCAFTAQVSFWFVKYRRRFFESKWKSRSRVLRFSSVSVHRGVERTRQRSRAQHETQATMLHARGTSSGARIEQARPDNPVGGAPTVRWLGAPGKAARAQLVHATPTQKPGSVQQKCRPETHAS